MARIIDEEESTPRHLYNNIPGGAMLMIHGYCAPRFNAVRDALAENLADPVEIGEAVTIMVAGDIVVDLWGGYRDSERTQPWVEDTLACMFSVGKPVAALPLLRLVDAGQVDLRDRVANYWPEYAVAGKEETTVDDILSHLAGIPGVTNVPRGSAYDWDVMIRGIEGQAPLWAPGTTGCYHTFTYGHLVGELTRRVTGKPIGQVVREDIADPLDIDLTFGLDADQLSRCANVSATPGDPLLAAIQNPATLIGKCWSALPLGEDNQAEGNEMAGYFMLKYEKLWSAWLPADVAARVKKALKR